MPLSTILCAIPAACWNPRPKNPAHFHVLAPLLAEFSLVERRLRLEVNIDDERRRYRRLVQQIGAIVLEYARRVDHERGFRETMARHLFPAMHLGREYTDFLYCRHLQSNVDPAIDDTLGIGSLVLRPAALATHRTGFLAEARRMGYADYPALSSRHEFLGWSLGGGLVEAADGVSAYACQDDREVIVRPRPIWPDWVTRIAPRLTPSERRLPAPGSRLSTLRGPHDNGAADDDTGDWRRYQANTRQTPSFMKQRLHQQIEAALRGEGAVNMSNQKHATTVQVLSRFLHRDPDAPPGEIPIIYGDGSIAPPFPLRCVERLAPDWRSDRELRAALISMRHLPLDRHIHLNWLRNVEVPANKTFALADQTCYQESLEQFELLRERYADRRLALYLYHTGFPPAIVGFYRALANVLCHASGNGDKPRRAWLQVIPLLQPVGGEDSGRYAEGTPWPERERG